MKDFFFRHFKVFKGHSIFVTMLISLLFLSIVVCIFFSVYFTNTVIANTTAYRSEVTEMYLVALIDNIDNQILNLHQSLTQLSYSPSIFQLAVSRHYSQPNINLAMNTLGFTAENNLLIETVIYYIPHLDSVITSSKGFYSFDNCPYRDLISNYEESKTNRIAIADTGKTSFIYYTPLESV
jgi:hypothetical protein